MKVVVENLKYILMQINSQLKKYITKERGEVDIMKRALDEKGVFKVRELYAQGMKRMEIAKALNVSPIVITKVLNRSEPYRRII